MIEVRKSQVFIEWLATIRDLNAQAKIAIRIDRLQNGNYGDVKFFDGLGELRINYGPGYRVYFVKRGDVLVILLCGGDKSSQSRDITRAQKMAEEL